MTAFPEGGRGTIRTGFRCQKESVMKVVNVGKEKAVGVSWPQLLPIGGSIW